MKPNCLTAALECWHVEGGYVAPPMPLRGIALAAVVGCTGTLLWVAGRLVKRITRKLKWQF